MKKIILALLLVLALVTTSEGQRRIGGVQRGGPSGAGDPLRTPTGGGSGSPPAASGGFTYVRSAAGEVHAGTVSLTGVSAGNIIVVGCRWYNDDSGNASISDGNGSDTFTALTRRVDATGREEQLFYLLSSAASGSVTYTCTAPGSSAYVNVAAAEFSQSSPASYDTTNGAVGNSETLNTGNISTGAANSLVVVYGENGSGSDFTDLLIGGAAPDGSVQGGYGVNSLWWKIYTSTQTNISGGATTSTTSWAGTILSIKN